MIAAVSSHSRHCERDGDALKHMLDHGIHPKSGEQAILLADAVAENVGSKRLVDWREGMRKERLSTSLQSTCRF